MSLQTLPVDLVYRIFDQLSNEDLFLSTSNVCQRLNDILNTYPRYKVNYILFQNVFFSLLTFFVDNNEG